MDGYEASRRRMLETLSTGRRLRMPPHNDSPMIADLVRDGYLEEVAYTVAGTEYAITSAGKEHVAGAR